MNADELSGITQHVLQFAPDALIVIDSFGHIQFANETVTGLFGYTPDALIGRSIEMLVPSRFRDQHRVHVADFVRFPRKREMGTRVADLFVLRADGSEFPAAILLAPFHADDKLFIAAGVRDMTEQCRVDEELLVARQEADRANRDKSRFLAVASHDLRQPMQTIRLLNAAMLKVASELDFRDFLQRQSQAIDGMARLLNALLDISRLESGAIEPVISNVPLSEAFAQLRTEFESVARARGIEFHVDDSPMVLATDKTLLTQLLQNLLGNAMKYTDRGSVTLACASLDGELIVAVEDTGIGIPADKLERIFDEYYQVDTHGTKRSGVGLGLAIVREVARLLGFSIAISSAVGVGTQVRVHIPSRYVVDAPAHIPQAAVVAASGAPRAGARLFLVEDNDGVRLATETFLRLEGHEVQSAPSMSEAGAMLASLRDGDIVIADYHLDDRNTGLDVLLKLRERVGYAVPAIILSGDLPSAMRSVKLPVPNCKFLSKPVDAAELADTIAELQQQQTRVA